MTAFPTIFLRTKTYFSSYKDVLYIFIVNFFIIAKSEQKLEQNLRTLKRAVSPDLKSELTVLSYLSSKRANIIGFHAILLST